jgi:hypothetical protein
MNIAVLVKEPRIAGPHAGASHARSRWSESDESSYRTWLGHTQRCPTCRAGASCSTAGRLGRAWREARRG